MSPGWYSRNREHALEVNRAWKKNNPEKVREQRRRWREKYRERVNERHREWYKKNPERRREHSRSYYQEHKESAVASRKRWKALAPRCYITWVQMRQRCNNPSNSNYPRYGAKGIKVCERWESFAAFLEDMGDKPKGWNLHRKDPDGDYTKDNCVWLSKSEHMKITARNRK